MAVRCFFDIDIGDVREGRIVIELVEQIVFFFSIN